MTQTEKVLNYLETHDSITQYDAFRELGIMRLASRISDLKQAHFPIVKKMKTVIARDGTKTKVAEYSLVKNIQPGESLGTTDSPSLYHKSEG